MGILHMPLHCFIHLSKTVSYHMKRQDFDKVYFFHLAYPIMLYSSKSRQIFCRKCHRHELTMVTWTAVEDQFHAPRFCSTFKDDGMTSLLRIMANTSLAKQTYLMWQTFANAILESTFTCWFKFHWILFARVQLWITGNRPLPNQCWLRCLTAMGLTRQHIWTNWNLVMLMPIKRLIKYDSCSFQNNIYLLKIWDCLSWVLC